MDEEPAPFRYRWPLTFVAVLSTLLVTVITGFNLADSHSPGTEPIVAFSHAQTMSATELIQSVKAGFRTVYWLNAKHGDSYSNNGSTSLVYQISYLSVGSDTANLKQFDMMIRTYRNFDTFDEKLHRMIQALPTLIADAQNLVLIT